MRVTPKINVSPDAMRNRNIAFASPLRSWIARNCSAQRPENGVCRRIAGRGMGPPHSRRDTLTRDRLSALESGHETVVAGFGNAQKPRSRRECGGPPPRPAPRGRGPSGTTVYADPLLGWDTRFNCPSGAFLPLHLMAAP